MTTITAKVIADSISPQGIRLTTLQLRYPKCVHNEFMTHRVFSRNASSSRAIPVQRMIQDVIEDPYIPIYWGKNQPGMQAHEECDEQLVLNQYMWRGTSCNRKTGWLLLRDQAVDMAMAFAHAGYHKQIVNRLIEPWAHINVVVTATEWTNFFALRDHPDAQPEIQALAHAMREAMTNSTPKLLEHGQWHLPYVILEDNPYMRENWEPFIKLSVARCARVSYRTQEGKHPTREEDLALYDRLISSVPLHASPAEHQATPDKWVVKSRTNPNPVGAMGTLYEDWERTRLHGNFRGWIQYRKTLKGECQ